MISGFSFFPTRLPSLSARLVLIALMASGVLAGGMVEGTDQLAAGTSSQKAKRQAIESIPMQNLTSETQQKIGPILERPSIYRRLPVTAINVDPDYFVFLVRYPEVVVNIWKMMGITQMATARTGPFEIATDDGAGTISNVELVYGTPNLHIFYGEGRYEGPVLKRQLNGSCVLVLRTEYRQDANGEPVATSSLDVFLKVENATVSLVARTLNPIVGRTADHNFVESLNFVQRLSETTRDNGPGVQRMATRLTDLTDDVRQGFTQIAGMVYERQLPASSALSSSPSISALPTSSSSYSGSGGLSPSVMGQPTQMVPAILPAGTSLPSSSGFPTPPVVQPGYLPHPSHGQYPPPSGAAGNSSLPLSHSNVPLTLPPGTWPAQPAGYSIPATPSQAWQPFHRQTGYQAPVYSGRGFPPR